MTVEDELPRSVVVQHAIGEEQRNGSRKNEPAGPKRKHSLVMDVSGGETEF